MLEQGAQTYYDMLGVDRSASAEDITAAYRQALTETNTFDADSDHETETIELIKTVTLAYRTLVDEQKRREYDALLDGTHLPEESGTTAVYDAGHVSLAEAPSLTSAELATLRKGESAQPQAAITRVVYDVGHAFSPRSEDDIPEEWREERAFFEEHFEEILKPAPKVDLVGAKKASEQETYGEVASLAEWEESSGSAPASSRFGTMPAPSEMSQLQAIPSPRRAIARSLVADPFDLIFYFGLPLIGVIIAVEFFVYMR